ncbi:unnamed protein product [Parnassius apollo]|uniref:(apollo) hypothetical protein n=1 Tax=Parnassius apollo TaxID=110799 RepID=A0A8S3Y460_PARAO|nr:unnamed protein product [Parnassius apollo]
MKRALEEVKNHHLSMYAASKKYQIPTTTLFERLKGISTKSVGRPQAIPIEDEKRLAEAIRVMEKWGFGLSRREILEMVEDYVKKNNLNTVFKNNKPGTDWFINFRKRNRLSIKKPQPVEHVRKQMTDPFIIFDYFDLLQDTLTELDLFEKPHLIWNLDETSLCMDPTKTKAINKPCSRTTCGSGKENVTVLATASAAGNKLDPLIIYKGKNLWDQWITDSQNYDFDIAYAASAKGWMETEIFYNYFEKVLIPALVPVDKFESEAYKRYLKKKDEHSQSQLESKNPKSLKELCVRVLNEEFYFSEAPNRAGKVVSTLSQNDFSSEYVTFLSQLSKKDDACQPFVANNTSDSPKCLQFQKSCHLKPKENEKPKINIISNLKVNFEDLLLEKVRQEKRNKVPVKKKRVAKGKRPKEVKQPSQTGTSGTKKVNKRRQSKKSKRQENLDKSTSHSETISIYSDTDINESSFLDDLLNEEEFKFLEENIGDGTYDECAKILNEVNVSKKGKGKGKKSKGKENTEDKNEVNKDVDKNDKKTVKNGTDIKSANTTEDEEEKDIQDQKDGYELNDSVLVRYYCRKKWNYFVGFIEKVINKDEETYYTVNFLKTIRRPQLTFVISKKKDYDEVTKQLIVKKVKLEKNNESYKEYILSEENDKIYF